MQETVGIPKDGELPAGRGAEVAHVRYGILRVKHKWDNHGIIMDMNVLH